MKIPAYARMMAIFMALSLCWVFVPAQALPALEQDEVGPALDQGEMELSDDSDVEQIRAAVRALFDADEREALPGAARVEIGPSELMPAEGLDPEWMNILLLGTDDRSGNMRGRTDSIMILSIHKTTAEVKVTSIMRDIWTTMHRAPTHKINAANVFGGPNLAMRTVNERFGMNITRYVMTNLQGLASLIDAVGGLDLDISAGERRWINAYLEEYRRFTGSKSVDQNVEGRANLATSGPNTHLTGAQAAAYCRNRYMGNDQMRTQRQRIVLMALASTLMELGEQELIALLPMIFSSVQTNLTIGDLVALVPVVLRVDLDGVLQERIPFSGTYQSGMYGSVWCIKPNFEKNAELLRAHIYGEGDGVGDASAVPAAP